MAVELSLASQAEKKRSFEFWKFYLCYIFV